MGLYMHDDWDNILFKVKEQYGSDLSNKLSEMIDENKIREVINVVSSLGVLDSDHVIITRQSLAAAVAWADKDYHNSSTVDPMWVRSLEFKLFTLKGL